MSIQADALAALEAIEALNPRTHTVSECNGSECAHCRVRDIADAVLKRSKRPEPKDKFREMERSALELVDYANSLNATSFEVGLENVTIEGKRVGDWKVTARRVRAPKKTKAVKK